MKFFDRFRLPPFRDGISATIVSTPGVEPSEGVRAICAAVADAIADGVLKQPPLPRLAFTDAEKIVLAIEHLRAARTLLREAGAKRTLERCQRTLTSADGARRHAQLLRRSGGEECL